MVSVVTDLLQESPRDMITLSLAVEDRFKSLCDTHLRLRGKQLTIPKSLQADMVRWRTMAVRHRAGDFRNTNTEKKSVRAIAQWLVNTNCELRNQVTHQLTWKD